MARITAGDFPGTVHRYRRRGCRQRHPTGDTVYPRIILYRYSTPLAYIYFNVPRDVAELYEIIIVLYCIVNSCRAESDWCCKNQLLANNVECVGFWEPLLYGALPLDPRNSRPSDPSGCFLRCIFIHSSPGRNGLIIRITRSDDLFNSRFWRDINLHVCLYVCMNVCMTHRSYF